MARPRTVRKLRRGRIWWISYWLGEERVRESTGTDNAKIAEEIRKQREAEVTLDLLQPEERIKMKDFFAEYLQYSRGRKRRKTYQTDLGRLEPFIKSLNVRYPSDVTTPMVMRYMSRKKERDGIEDSTVLRIRECLHALFQYACLNGYVKRNPVSAVPKPRLPEKDIRFLLPGDIENVLNAVEGERIGPIVRTCLYAGLRREETCWLRWEDMNLDPERPVMRIRMKVVGEEVWYPKTRKNRSIPIHRQELLQMFERLEAERDGQAWVFPSPRGVRWNPDNLSSRYRRVMQKAGLKWNMLDLRHTFGSRLAQAGRSLYEISTLMGNSPGICQKHYARLLPEHMHERLEV